MELDSNPCLVIIVVNPDSPEERGEQLSLDGVQGANVQRLGALKDIEVGQYSVGPCAKFLVGGAELVADSVLPDLNVFETIA
ncbi:hypothetical protein ABMA10_18565 [Plantibacter sp. RU18]